MRPGSLSSSPEKYLSWRDISFRRQLDSFGAWTDGRFKITITFRHMKTSAEEGVEDTEKTMSMTLSGTKYHPQKDSGYEVHSKLIREWVETIFNRVHVKVGSLNTKR